MKFVETGDEHVVERFGALCSVCGRWRFFDKVAMTRGHLVCSDCKSKKSLRRRLFKR